jgi:N-sulfoglucosamine sulfohydrolase
MNGLAHLGFSFDTNVGHLSRLLKERGFSTFLAGIQHEVPEWTALGYDEYIGENPEAPYRAHFSPQEWDSRNAAAVVKFLSGRVGESAPFFLSWGLFFPHRPYLPPSEETVRRTAAINAASALGLPVTEAVIRDVAGYQESLLEADSHIGRVLDTLEDTGLLHSTAVLYTTDHGVAFPGHKCTLSARGIGAACMLRLPDRYVSRPFPPSVSDAMTSHLDAVPTLLALADGEEKTRGGEGGGDGLSLLPLCGGKTAGEFSHRRVYASISYHAAYEPCRAVRTRDFSYIRYWMKPGPVWANIDDSPTKEELACRVTDHRFVQVLGEQLYDLRNDPDESRNLAGDVRFEKIRRRLSQELERWMHESGDPLCSGAVPAPEGARVTDRSAYSPLSVSDFHREE